jgi:hypothetical protein
MKKILSNFISDFIAFYKVWMPNILGITLLLILLSTFLTDIIIFIPDYLAVSKITENFGLLTIIIVYFVWFYTALLAWNNKITLINRFTAYFMLIMFAPIIIGIVLYTIIGLFSNNPLYIGAVFIELDKLLVIHFGKWTNGFLYSISNLQLLVMSFFLTLFVVYKIGLIDKFFTKCSNFACTYINKGLCDILKKKD